MIVVGCTNQEYDDAMEKGKEGIQDKNYAEAIESFEKAKNEKQDDEKVNSLLTQSEMMESGILNFNAREFEEASEDFNSILEMNDEYLILKEDAEKQLAEIDKKQKLIKELDDSYEKARELKDAGDYEGALKVIEKELDKDLSHGSLDESKEELEGLKKEINDVNTALKDAQGLLEEEEYKEGMDLIDETLNKNEVYGEKMHEFDKVYAKLQSNIPSPDPYKINNFEGEYIYLGGVVSQVMKDENDRLEELMIYLYKDPNPAKKDQSSAYPNMHVSINTSDKDVVDELEGIESNDQIYFYGFGEGEYTYKNMYDKERTAKGATLEKVDSLRKGKIKADEF